MPVFSLPTLELSRFRTSLKSRAALVVIAIIPALYGGLYLTANWSPTQNLENLTAAIVNEDTPVTVETPGSSSSSSSSGSTRTIDAGSQLAESITKPDADAGFTWVETDAATASAGLDDGTYAATVVVPSDFSKKLSTVSGDDPEQAKISVTTNDANNYIVGTVTTTIAAKLREQVQQSSTESYLDNVYLAFNSVHGSLSDAADGASQLADGASDASTGAGKAKDGSAQLVVGLGDLSTGLDTAASGSAQLAEGAGTLDTGAQTLKTGLDELRSETADLPAQSAELDDGAGQALAGSQKLAAGAATLVGGLGELDTGIQTLVDAEPELIDGATALSSGAQQVSDGAESAASGASSLSAGSSGIEQALVGLQAGYANMTSAQQAVIDELVTQSGAVTTGAQTLSENLGTLSAGASGVSDGATALGAGLDLQSAGIDALKAGSADALAGAEKLSARLGEAPAGAENLPTGSGDLVTGLTTLKAGTATLAGKAPELADGVVKLDEGAVTLADGSSTLSTKSGELASGIAKLDSGAGTAASGATTLDEGLGDLDTGLGKLDSGSSELATKLADGTDKVPTYDSTQRDSLSSTVADPVVLQRDRLNAVETYGDGMAAYFIPLALWIGGIVTYMIIRALSPRALATTAPSWRVALAGYTPGAFFGALQALILSGILFFAVGLNTPNPVGLVLFSVLIGVVFMAIHQCLIALFGGVGRLLALVLLMLQLASAGGTYPVATSPEFFQAISPFLPMTYAVAGVRDIIAGGAANYAWIAAGHLVLFLLGALAVSIFAAHRGRLWTIDKLHPSLAI